MSKKLKKEFEQICEDIINNDSFKNLNKELHHGITRYEHSMRVAKATYYILKYFKNKKIEETTRAALLHDFYTDNDLINYSKVSRLSVHQDYAVENAKKIININKFQEDIIQNHMFPLSRHIPKTKESIIVSLVDKGVAIHEMTHYKMMMQIEIMLLFIINLISIY